MKQADYKPVHADDSFDLSGLLIDYLSNWKWFVACVAVAVGISWFIYSTKIPVYSVSASIYLSDENTPKTQSIFSGTDNPMVDLKDYIDETEVEILRSRNNLVKIVDSLGLAYNYMKVAPLKDIPLYGDNPVVVSTDHETLHNISAPVIFTVTPRGDSFEIEVETSFNGSPERKTTLTALPASVVTSQGTFDLSRSVTTTRTDGKYKIVVNNPDIVASGIASSLNIYFARNSSTILRIDYVTPVIREGEDVIKTLIDFYNQDIIDDKNRSAIQTEEFILDRLVMISSELKDVEHRLEEYRRANNINTSIDAKAELYTTKATANEEVIASIDVQQQILGEIENTVSRQDDYSMIASIAEDPELARLIEAYNKKVLQLQRTLETVTPDNPLVVKMQDDLLREKSRLLQSIRSVKNNLATRKGNVARRNAVNTGQLASVPSVDKGLQEIFREQQVKVNIYTFLLQKREEIALQKTLATPTARLIDSPAGTGPIEPRLIFFLLCAVVAGIALPMLVILVKRIVFPVFKDKEDLARSTQLPILGEIAISQTGGGLVVAEKTDDQISELFRLIRNNIEFTLTSKDKKVILVTSSLSGEGKSFFSSNLAVTFAMAGKKTILIGGDIRRPMVSRLFGISNKTGLTNFLAGAVENPDDIVIKAPGFENLMLVPGGPVAPNPNELLMNGRFCEMIDRFKKEYDYIIIDSAPIGIVSDSLLISCHTDIQIYVARANFTKRKCLKIVNQEVANGRLSHCYLVLNGVDMTSGTYSYRRYGSYGHYGSGYYGYGDKKPRKKGLFRK